MTPGSGSRSAGWRRAAAAEVADGTVDAQAFVTALGDGRAAAELHGVDVIEGARARHCRIAIDGPTFQAAFPRSAGSSGDRADRWRGELDYWVFLDGQLGRVAGSINGDGGRDPRGRTPGHGSCQPDRYVARPRLRIDPPAR